MASSTIPSHTWKYVNTATGKNAISLPTNWSELLVTVVSGENANFCFNIIINRHQVETSRYFNAGDRSNVTMLDGTSLPNSIKLFNMAYNGTDYSSSAKVYVYYK